MPLPTMTENFNSNIQKSQQKKELPHESSSLSFSPVLSSQSNDKVLSIKPELLQFAETFTDGEITPIPTFTDQERQLAFELGLRCVVFPIIKSMHAISLLSDGVFPLIKALNVPEHLVPVILSQVSASQNIWEFLHQLYNHVGKNPTYRPDCFENSRKYLLWMRAEEMEIDNLIEGLKREAPYQGRLHLGVVEASNIPLTDKGQAVSRPFVQVKLRGSSNVHSTKVASSWAPVWAENFEIDISDPSCDITVELWDKGTGISTDSLIGQAIFPLSTLANQLPVMGWFPVKPKNGKPPKNNSKFAEVHLKIHYTHRNIPPYRDDFPKGNSAGIVAILNDAKKSYKVLLEELNTFENPTWEQDGLTPLSTDAEWLLYEYSRRYRLGKIHCLLEYFQVLMHRFRLKKQHVEILVETVQLLTEQIMMDEAHPMNQELQQFVEIKQELKVKLERTLNKYQFCFPGPEGENWQKGTIHAVVMLFKELVRSAFSVKLTEIVTSSMEFTYNVWKQQYEDPAEFSALCDICDAMSNQIQIDVTHYAPEFKPDIDLASISIDTYYGLFRTDLENILEGDLKVKTETFILYSKLAELHSVLTKIQPGFEGIQLDAMFTKYQILWVHEAQNKLKKWCEKAIEVDKWQKTSSEQLHSTSVGDTFASCTSAIRYLVSLNLNLNDAIIRFAKASCTVLEMYTQKMIKSCVQDIVSCQQVLTSNNPEDPEADKIMELKLKLCVRVNNIEITREYLDDYMRDLEKYVDSDHSEVLDQCAASTFSFLRHKFDELLDIIVGKMNVYMQECIIGLLQNPPPVAQSEVFEEDSAEISEKLNPMFTYINNMLDLFAENLYHTVFVKILRRVWLVLIKDLELFLFPEAQENEDVKSEERISQANIVNFMLEKKLMKFFHAEGQGLPLNFLKGQCAILKRELELFNVPTTQLIDIYRSIEDEPEDDVDEASFEGSNQISALFTAILGSRGTDERAIRFVKAKAAMQDPLSSPVLRKTFKLPAEETLIGKYECYNYVGLKVTLYITTASVCIDSIFSSRKITIALKSIMTLSKSEKSGNNKTVSLKIKTANEELILHFTKSRKSAFTQIEAQTKQIGNTRLKAKTKAKHAGVPAVTIVEKSPPTSPSTKNVREPKFEQLNKFKNSFSLPAGEVMKKCYTCSLIASVPPGTPGDLFITNTSVYFYAKTITGSELKESFALSEIRSIAKKSTALIFSNAMQIKTSKKEYFFGSFSNRDEVYCLLEEMWDKVKHQLPPPPPSDTNGVSPKIGAIKGK